MKEKIIYTADNKKEQTAPYLYITKAAIIDECLQVCVMSDRNIVELFVDGQLLFRQKNSGCFVFNVCENLQGNIEIKAAEYLNDKLCDVINIRL